MNQRQRRSFCCMRQRGKHLGRPNWFNGQRSHRSSPTYHVGTRYRPLHLGVGRGARVLHRWDGWDAFLPPEPTLGPHLLPSPSLRYLPPRRLHPRCMGTQPTAIVPGPRCCAATKPCSQTESDLCVSRRQISKSDSTSLGQAMSFRLHKQTTRHPSPSSHHSLYPQTPSLS